jgi:hypothetical protein
VESDFKLGRVEKKNPEMNNPGLKKKAKSQGESSADLGWILCVHLG